MYSYFDVPRKQEDCAPRGGERGVLPIAPAALHLVEALQVVDQHEAVEELRVLRLQAAHFEQQSREHTLHEFERLEAQVQHGAL